MSNSNSRATTNQEPGSQILNAIPRLPQRARTLRRLSIHRLRQHYRLLCHIRLRHGHGTHLRPSLWCKIEEPSVRCKTEETPPLLWFPPDGYGSWVVVALLLLLDLRSSLFLDFFRCVKNRKKKEETNREITRKLSLCDFFFCFLKMRKIRRWVFSFCLFTSEVAGHLSSWSSKSLSI